MSYRQLFPARADCLANGGRQGRTYSHNRHDREVCVRKHGACCGQGLGAELADQSEEDHAPKRDIHHQPESGRKTNFQQVIHLAEIDVQRSPGMKGRIDAAAQIYSHVNHGADSDADKRAPACPRNTHCRETQLAENQHVVRRHIDDLPAQRGAHGNNWPMYPHEKLIARPVDDRQDMSVEHDSQVHHLHPDYRRWLAHQLEYPRCGRPHDYHDNQKIRGPHVYRLPVVVRAAPPVTPAQTLTYKRVKTYQRANREAARKEADKASR